MNIITKNYLLKLTIPLLIANFTVFGMNKQLETNPETKNLFWDMGNQKEYKSIKTKHSEQNFTLRGTEKSVMDPEKNQYKPAKIESNKVLINNEHFDRGCAVSLVSTKAQGEVFLSRNTTFDPCDRPKNNELKSPAEPHASVLLINEDTHKTIKHFLPLRSILNANNGTVISIAYENRTVEATCTGDSDGSFADKVRTAKDAFLRNPTFFGTTYGLENLLENHIIQFGPGLGFGPGLNGCQNDQDLARKILKDQIKGDENISIYNHVRGREMGGQQKKLTNEPPFNGRTRGDCILF